jgi:hypothetical protein
MLLKTKTQCKKTANICNNYTINVNTWDPKCTEKCYGSVLKIRPDDGSIGPKYVTALNVF